MSKVTKLAVGLLGAIAILPASQAMAATGNTSTAIHQPDGDLHAQVIFKAGPQWRDRGYSSSSWEAERYRRRLEWEREREARARARWGRGYYHRQDRYYRPSDYHRDYRY